MSGELFKPGDMVRTLRSGKPCRVEKFLGAGGQGEVYRVEWEGAKFALKFFHEHIARDTPSMRPSIEALVDTKPPSARFLWPLDIAEADNVRSFGYLMGLREPRFKGLIDLMAGRVDPTFRAIITAGLQLTDSFYRLHSDGLCYRDINFGNAFFDPLTGDVLVCDNDNVAANRSEALVLGTPDFMAPEIVMGKGLPSRQTDLFSLAVLLFYMMHVGHPLYGRRAFNIKCLDGPARLMLCGTHATFIFDPVDKSNEAVSTIEEETGECGGTAKMYWNIYTQAVRDAFTRSFTTGIKDPEHGRLTEGEWRRVLADALDAIFYCGCGKENFYDLAYAQANGGKPRACWSCSKTPTLPFRLRVGNGVVMLSHNTKLAAYRIGLDSSYEPSKVVGEVVQNPANPSQWGLKNLTQDRWVATLTDGSLRDVEPGRSVPLVSGVKVNFGSANGEVQY